MGLKEKVEALKKKKKKKNPENDFLLKCLHSTGFGGLWTLYSGKKPQPFFERICFQCNARFPYPLKTSEKLKFRQWEH